MAAFHLTYNDTQIVNSALARIGCQPVQSLDEPYGPQGEIPRRVYDAITRSLMGMREWVFTKQFGALTRQGDGKAGWASAFVLPPNRIDMPSAYYDSANDTRPVRFFEHYDNKVHANSNQLYCAFRAVPVSEFWPSYFQELHQVVLMSEFAMAIREDKVLRRELRNQAFGNDQYMGQGGQFAVAADLDVHGAAQMVAPSGGEELHIIHGGSFNSFFRDRGED